VQHAERKEDVDVRLHCGPRLFFQATEGFCPTPRAGERWRWSSVWRSSSERRHGAVEPMGQGRASSSLCGCRRVSGESSGGTGNSAVSGSAARRLVYGEWLD
jgi:hypothetical protein